MGVVPEIISIIDKTKIDIEENNITKNLSVCEIEL